MDSHVHYIQYVKYMLIDSSAFVFAYMHSINSIATV